MSHSPRGTWSNRPRIRLPERFPMLPVYWFNWQTEDKIERIDNLKKTKVSESVWCVAESISHYNDCATPTYTGTSAKAVPLFPKSFPHIPFRRVYSCRYWKWCKRTILWKHNEIANQEQSKATSDSKCPVDAPWCWESADSLTNSQRYPLPNRPIIVSSQTALDRSSSRKMDVPATVRQEPVGFLASQSPSSLGWGVELLPVYSSLVTWRWIYCAKDVVN